MATPTKTMVNHVTNELAIRDLRMPVANRIGEEGKGFRVGESDVPPAGPSDFDTGYTVVELTLDEGRTHVVRVDVTRVHSADPLSDHELRTKLFDCFAESETSALANGVWTTITANPGAAITSALARRESS